MKYTTKLGLPIWNKPETDVFDIEQFNEGMQAIDNIVINILEQINDLVIGDTQIDLNGYVKEEVLKCYTYNGELSCNIKILCLMCSIFFSSKNPEILPQNSYKYELLLGCYEL